MLEVQEGKDAAWSKEELAKNIKDLMVASTSEDSQHLAFFQMRQQHNKPIRDFHIRLVSTAETCNFMTECKAKSVCGSKFVSFKDEMMRSGLILGLYDSYIQQQAITRCSKQKSKRLSLKDLLEFVANLESAHHVGQSMKGGSTSVNAISSYKSAKKEKTLQKQEKE